ncbi:unnamed protein product [Staurois parvus]|uniref:Uncharacterized protein n=1 Tax=Staurois parvus TaxID=386267 RepID=A0ABN9DPJ9_9NEOB|nr:unnamed protein product [Staurois parvus]
MGPPGNRGSWGPCVLAQTQKSLPFMWVCLLTTPRNHFAKCGEMCRIVSHGCRGGLTTHGPPGNRGSWGPCVLTQTQKSL